MASSSNLSKEKLDRVAGGLTRESTLKRTLPGLANDDTSTLEAYGKEHVRLQNAERNLKTRNEALQSQLDAANAQNTANKHSDAGFMNRISSLL